MIAKVIVDVNIKKLNRPFDYYIPLELQGLVELGTRVIVPFNVRKIMGIVIEITGGEQGELKAVESCIDIKPTFNSELLSLGSQIATETASNLIHTYKTMIPSAMKAKYRKYAIVDDKKMYIDQLSPYEMKQLRKNYPDIEVVYEVKEKGSKKTEKWIQKVAEEPISSQKQQAVVDYLGTDEVLKKDIVELFGVSAIKTLIKHGVLVEEEKEEQTETKIDFDAPVAEQDPVENEPIDPKFEFVSSKYGNLELGRRAFPAFMDVDGDNNLDLVVGNKAGELRYYRREQNSVDAKWTLEDKNFLGYQGGRNSAPVFADLDGDADLDLLVGNQQGSILYWENKGSFEIAEFVYNPTPFIGVTGGRNSVPAVLDLNSDGLNDLIVGNFLGQLYKYVRTESSAGFRFRLEIRKYLNLDAGLGSVPQIADLNNDQLPDLIIGSDSGKIISFQIDPKKTGSISWKPNPEYFKELNLPVGGNPVFVDLDNDGDLDLIVGSEAGTLYYFRNTGR